jgi:hypothetical protein
MQQLVTVPRLSGDKNPSWSTVHVNQINVCREPLCMSWPCNE